MIYFLLQSRKIILLRTSHSIIKLITKAANLKQRVCSFISWKEFAKKSRDGIFEERFVYLERVWHRHGSITPWIAFRCFFRSPLLGQYCRHHFGHHFYPRPAAEDIVSLWTVQVRSAADILYGFWNFRSDFPLPMATWLRYFLAKHYCAFIRHKPVWRWWPWVLSLWPV